VLECVHRGSVAVCRPDGSIEFALGTVDQPILPRSACKMVQALPLVESGAADSAGLTDRHLALACASHNGAAIHSGLTLAWLDGLGLGETDLRCGPQVPADADAVEALRVAGEQPCQLHNNCSGKHSGMLTLNRHLGGSSEYIDPDHPVQRAVRAATEETADQNVAGHAVDGCSAPNFAITLSGLARQMAGFARPDQAFGGVRRDAATRLRDAMMAHPELVAGEDRACTNIMRACAGKAAVKTGAEGVFIGILPETGLGIALKIDDGATRSSEAAITALLARYGALDRADPVFSRYADAPLLNRRHIDCGRVQAAVVLSE
jgi:L-asparaginase II